MGAEAKTRPLRVDFLLRLGDGFEHDLGAFQRQAAGLHQAERGQRLFAIVEGFADQVAYAAEVARAGDEGADAQHVVAAGLPEKRLQGISHLRGEEPFAESGVTWKVSRRVSPVTVAGSSSGNSSVWVISFFFFCGAGSQEKSVGNRHHEGFSGYASAFGPFRIEIVADRGFFPREANLMPARHIRVKTKREVSKVRQYWWLAPVLMGVAFIGWVATGPEWSRPRTGATTDLRLPPGFVTAFATVATEYQRF